MTSTGSVVILNHLPKERFVVASTIYSSHIIYREDSPELGAFCIHLNGDNCYTAERRKYSTDQIAEHLGISTYAVQSLGKEFGEFGELEHEMRRAQSIARRAKYKRMKTTRYRRL